MITEGHELGWEDTITKDAQEFVTIEPGDYSFTIDHFDRARSGSDGKYANCNMAVVYFNIDAEGNPQIRENYLLHSNFEWKLSQLFAGVGLKKKGEELVMNWNALPGMTGRCKVSLDQDKNDPKKKYNHIKEIYPMDGAKTFKKGSF